MSANTNDRPAIGSHPQSYHHGDLKKTLIDAACRQLKSSSAENLSLRALAREAGVSQTAPYRHFKTKNSLFAAIATTGFEEMLAALEQGAQAVGTEPVERVIAIGTYYLQWALANPEKYKLCFDSVIVDLSQYRELHEAADACFSFLTAEIRGGVEAGVFVERPVEELAVYLWASVHGIASLLLGRVRDSDDTPEDSSRAMGHLRNHSRDVIRMAVAALTH